MEIFQPHFKCQLFCTVCVPLKCLETYPEPSHYFESPVGAILCFQFLYFPGCVSGDFFRFTPLSSQLPDTTIELYTSKIIFFDIAKYSVVYRTKSPPVDLELKGAKDPGCYHILSKTIVFNSFPQNPPSVP